MELTVEQEKMLKGGSYGERKALELLIALGDIYGAPELIPITSAHISGASYKTIGDPGIKFLSEMSEGSRSKVRSTVNPIGMDRERYDEMRVPEKFVQKQNEIISLYEKMGVADSWTCTPYLVGNKPGLGEHISWAESSAVVYSNSVLGARTNREGGPSALASSIVGLTPNYGLHREENRLGEVLVEIDFRKKDLDYAALGSFVGRFCVDRIPYFRNLPATEDDLKTLSASLASSGSVSMFHVENSTPEWQLGLRDGYETITVQKKELDEVAESWNTSDEPDLIAFGCPHCSVSELKMLARLLERGWSGPELWACTSRKCSEQARDAVNEINKHGKVLCDTCVIVSSIEDFSSAVGTNSGKASTYLPTLCKQKIAFDNMGVLIGRYQ